MILLDEARRVVGVADEARLIAHNQHIEREGTEIIEVPDGIVFPILASLSAFAVKTPRGWKIQPPAQFNDIDLIKAAKSTYQEIARSNPQTMGKNKACYSALYQITSLYRRLTK
jgi:hypothetical protein